MTYKADINIDINIYIYIYIYISSTHGHRIRYLKEPAINQVKGLRGKNEW